MVARSGGDGPSYPIGTTLDVGRSEGHVLVPEDGYLSPRHVRLTWTDGALWLRDLGSPNGVYVRLSPHLAAPPVPPRPGADPGEIEVPLVDQI